MKKGLLITTALALFLNVNAQTNEEVIYSINNNTIQNNQSYIDNVLTYANNLNFTTNEISTVTVDSTIYSIRVGRFIGWQNEPGDFDIIQVYKNTQCKMTFKSEGGIVKLNDVDNLYSKNFNLYSTNGYFIKQTISSTSKALIFLGQHYGTDLPKLLIFVLTNNDVELVYCKPMIINSVSMSNGQFSMEVQSNILEYRDDGSTYYPAKTHTIWLKDGALKFKDNN